MSWMWQGIKIPERYCFAKDADGNQKKCTPSCKSYDLGWTYLTDEEEDEEVTEVFK